VAAVSEDDGGMQYWQQLGQQEQEVLEQENENVSNGQPAPVKSGILRSNCDGIYSER
jgi:hypothetical protein